VPRVGVASAAAHAVSVAAPAVSAMRMPDVQADLKSIRDPATMEPADAAAMGRSASPSARGSSLSAGRAVPEQQNLAIRQGKRNGRSVDESFSDWLDDGELVDTDAYLGAQLRCGTCMADGRIESLVTQEVPNGDDGVRGV
jgi:hypothetical protein